ncbi:hypothetical protein RHGRI_030502 [Rhododendron griersonianum]|uniref:Uncharacterized protein n=1 Tax=Rhododendron griersonianum TaxID=479676 RepID=A0AAV6INS9_9ERIC|nr:hypothetical protein RHGRI_030502 [Rhododendron griersonianum]
MVDLRKIDRDDMHVDSLDEKYHACLEDISCPTFNEENNLTLNEEDNLVEELLEHSSMDLMIWHQENLLSHLPNSLRQPHCKKYIILELRLKGKRNPTLSRLWLLVLGDQNESRRQEFGMWTGMFRTLPQPTVAMLEVSVNESMLLKIAILIHICSELHNVGLSATSL